MISELQTIDLCFYSHWLSSKQPIQNVYYQLPEDLLWSTQRRLSNGGVLWWLWMWFHICFAGWSVCAGKWMWMHAGGSVLRCTYIVGAMSSNKTTINGINSKAVIALQSEYNVNLVTALFFIPYSRLTRWDSHFGNLTGREGTRVVKQGDITG